MAADEEKSVQHSNGGTEGGIVENGAVNGVTVKVATENGNGDIKNVKEAEKRRRRRKQKKKSKGEGKELTLQDYEGKDDKSYDEDAAQDVEIELVSGKLEVSEDNPYYEDFLKVFERFNTAEEMFPTKVKEEAAQEEEGGNDAKKAEADSDEEEDGGETRDGLSNKKKKMLRRMKVAELKQMCPRPDVVEVWDATAADPRLLVHLKAYRNTVPVPRHWSQKRKYLQGKRGIEKQPWQLPDFIAATGIEKLRQAYVEKEDSKKLKQKQREKMQPKMGKMDIDYQVLHDAFFKYQSKPKLTHFGELYHEGKEFEVKLKEFKPGQLSDELKEALGMGEASPPPWLVNMQRYGPPPSYPHLKIAGLNCPIPEGSSFGYHSGGWGLPPVDEFGQPLYGDVFGTQTAAEPESFEDEPVDKQKHWGDLEEEEEEEEEDEEYEDGEGMDEEALAAGITSVDTISTTPAGVETPDVIDLRKAQRKEPEKPLYHVLEEKEISVGAGALMGGSHTYQLPGAAAGAKKPDILLKGAKADRVDITLRPEELEGLDDTAIAQKYEQAREEESLRTTKEDFSDMVAEAEKKRKRKAADKEEKKKKKDFKF